MFTLRQGDHLVQDLYASLRALLDELEVYQLFVVDISKMKEYHEELAVAIFQTVLVLVISSQICSQILGVDGIPSLSSIFSRILRISTRTLAPVSDQSTMVSTTRGGGRGRGCGCSTGGRCDTH